MTSTYHQHQALIITEPGSLHNGLFALLTSIPQLSVMYESTNEIQVLGIMSEFKPDLVLINAMATNQEDWSLLKKLKAGWPETPCIVLTEDFIQQTQATLMGADAVFVRGFPAAKLSNVIEDLLFRKNR